MEKVNKFFFLSGVNVDVKCDFRRFDDKIVMVFCHCDDKEKESLLHISVRTVTNICHETQKEMQGVVISYALEGKHDVLSNGDSLPIFNNNDFIFGAVASIVNDAFTNVNR